MEINHIKQSAAGWLRWVPLALFVLTVLWMVFFQSLENAVAFSVMDDGLYYPRLAQNIVARGMCTYDGVTETNGFHPLWLVTLLPLYALIHNPWAALWSVYGLIFIIQIVSVLLFSRLARAVKMSAAGWFVALFLLVINLRSFTIFFSFLESPLVLLTLLGYLAFCFRAGEERFSNPWKAFAGGLLLGLCFLARLDAFWLSLCFAGAWAFHFVRRPDRWLQKTAAAAAAAAGCLLLAIPYLAWNGFRFGHLQTVSAWQKTAEVSPQASWQLISGWTIHQFIPRVQHILGWENVPAQLLLAAGLSACGAGLLYALTGSRRRQVLSAWSLCPEFTLFVAVHALFIVLVAPQEAAASAWYWVPEILLLALTAGAVLPDILPAGIPLIPLGIVCLVILQLSIYPKLVQRKTMSFAKLEVARFLREKTDKNFRGAMFDSGIVSYFSQRDFVGINGLIGDFQHAEMIKNKQYAEAYSRCGVDFLVLDTPENLLAAFHPFVLYVSEIKTKFENFSEPPKPFVVYTATPSQLEKIWKRRYGRMR